MVLTMTRTRTQTTLTKLAELIANVHGELAFVDELLESSPKHVVALRQKRARLLAMRDALYLTLNLFDATLNPEDICCRDDWVKAFARNKGKTATRRYLYALEFVNKR
jgi:hypothetical protein